MNIPKIHVIDKDKRHLVFPYDNEFTTQSFTLETVKYLNIKWNYFDTEQSLKMSGKYADKADGKLAVKLCDFSGTYSRSESGSDSIKTMVHTVTITKPTPYDIEVLFGRSETNYQTNRLISKGFTGTISVSTIDSPSYIYNHKAYFFKSGDRTKQLTLGDNQYWVTLDFLDYINMFKEGRYQQILLSPENEGKDFELLSCYIQNYNAIYGTRIKTLRWFYNLSLQKISNYIELCECSFDDVDYLYINISGEGMKPSSASGFQLDQGFIKLAKKQSGTSYNEYNFSQGQVQSLFISSPTY